MTVERIAVLRPNALGDFVFVLPALRALRETFPHARLTYLGRAWHAAFLPGRGIVDEVVVVPEVPGLGASASSCVKEAAVEAFCREMRLRRFDLALQLYGGGAFSNPFVRRLGAAFTAGLCASDAPPLDRTLPYAPLQNERLRLLEAVALVGARTTELAPRIPVLERDREELEAQVRLPHAPLAVLQPGATDPRRRWPAERFAAVGDALARAGGAVAVQGSRAERELTAAVVRAMRAPAFDLGGALGLGGLAALLARARLVVSNDTGPLHLAQALGTATVGIYWLTNLLVSAPLVSAQHAHALGLRTACAVCGEENLRVRCSHDPSFVDDVSVEEVTRLALERWHAAAHREAPARARGPHRPGATADPTPRGEAPGRAAPSAPYPRP